MTVKQQMQYETEDGATFYDAFEATKHDLALQAGTTVDHLDDLALALAAATESDVEAAFKSVIDGGPPHPLEEAVHYLNAAFEFGRRPHVDPAASGLAASIDALNRQNAAPRIMAPARDEDNGESGQQGPKSDIFTHQDPVAGTAPVARRSIV